jgi:hypothetical protein
MPKSDDLRKLELECMRLSTECMQLAGDASKAPRSRLVKVTPSTFLEHGNLIEVHSVLGSDLLA